MIRKGIFIGLAVVGLVLGWQFGSQRTTPPDTSFEISDNTLSDLLWDNLDDGQNRLTEWQGKVLVVNHWATWCEPCRKEIPMFMDVLAQYQTQGLELIGIAHDDKEAVRRYVDAMGMEYPQLLAGPMQGSKWLASLGSNGSLPLTLVFDRQGQLRAKKLGLMSEAQLRQAIVDLL